ncbi:hypothetical protein J1C56_02060 [Aminobacter anthyllidis]|uniref:Uncharacterized protein n=1 Tax=Aminobacter anthyllidis TaxID=1035067 RepID=A0A9X1D452_9HYPH|nr:hypothetical protein [Aminobacter anthyllidis]MBT1154369.1 hypothetical protein [Aminobacter anthyllidis]
MSYADPDRRQYTFAEASCDFSGNNALGMIRGPKGKTGRLKWASLAVTTTIAGTTGDAKINIGNAGDADAYMAWSIGEPAVDTFRSTDDSSQTTSPLTGLEIAANTEVLIAIVEDTTGDGAGDGVLTVCIDWAQ